MIRNWLSSSSFAIGAALLLSQNSGLQAQSINYAPLVSALPVHVGQPFTVSLAVPTIVPDGTLFQC